MGSYGGFYKGETKKKKKRQLEERAKREMQRQGYSPPKVEIIGKGQRPVE